MLDETKVTEGKRGIFVEVEITGDSSRSEEQNFLLSSMLDKVKTDL